MKQYRAPAPGIFYGHYPEKPQHEVSFLSKLRTTLTLPFVRLGITNNNQYAEFIALVTAKQSQISQLSETTLKARIDTLRALLAMEGFTTPLLAEVFAVISRLSLETLGFQPYHTQLLAARIMLDGKLAEMATGEGKTLAASICAATAAMAGIPVHLITANDYLVTRDAEIALPLYQALGLTVGTITQASNDTKRKAAYACNITYTTAKELVFDYLKDQSTRAHTNTPLHHRVANISNKPSTTLLRGLCMAIIDEADSIMIDEARVPLILSKNSSSEDEQQHYQEALSFASTLKKEHDFLLDIDSLSVKLTIIGQDKIKALTKSLGGIWQNTLHREEITCQALAALYLYRKDQQYLVQAGKVHIVDQITGRIAPGRVWSRGLHQLIEMKEGCKPSRELITVAQITYQRFFPRYLMLSGMSGTLDEARIELFSIYGLRINKVPLKTLSQRITLPTIIYPNQKALWRAVVNDIKIKAKHGRPILIGTDSVEDSEALSNQLEKIGLTHQVLNARQDQQEADIIRKAGKKNQITISTNMAGRGTDIKIEKEVAELGGLHVISCQHNASRRIDRQLLGRCARQGQPGSTQTHISMNKPLIQRLFPQWVAKLASDNGSYKPEWFINIIIRLPQWFEESKQCSQRHEMMKRDAKFEREMLLPE